MKGPKSGDVKPGKLFRPNPEVMLMDSRLSTAERVMAATEMARIYEPPSETVNSPLLSGSSDAKPPATAPTVLDMQFISDLVGWDQGTKAYPPEEQT